MQNIKHELKKADIFQYSNNHKKLSGLNFTKVKIFSDWTITWDPVLCSWNEQTLNENYLGEIKIED